MSTRDEIRDAIFDHFMDALDAYIVNSNVEEKLLEAIDALLDDPQNEGLNEFEIGGAAVCGEPECGKPVTGDDGFCDECSCQGDDFDRCPKDASGKKQHRDQGPETAYKGSLGFECETNECEEVECHRCFPRTGCLHHAKCAEFTKSGEGYTDDQAKKIGGGS